MVHEMRSTKSNISLAIKKETGLDVVLHKEDGYFYFYSDIKKTDLMLSSLYTTSVYVNTLGVFSIERWVEEFKKLLEEDSCFSGIDQR